jgi:peptide/nickel transport system substrate-binding protein
MSMALFSVLILFAVLLTACGGGNPATGNNTTPNNKKAILNLGAHVGGPYVRATSPFNPSANEGILGFVYEPLYFVNQIDGKETPLLASSYQWSEDFKKLTFTIRENVKWSDGQAFSAEDVAFTYNLLKKFPATDTRGLWNYLTSAEAPDAKTVVITFKQSYTPLFYNLASQVPMVPKHIFEKVKDPVTYNEDPVGTGPFKFDKLTPQMITYKKNADYWQADKVQIEELRLPQVTDNNVLLQKLIAGQIDWGSFFPEGSLDQTFVSKDPQNNHYWMPPYAMFSMYINLTKEPLNDVALRQAMAWALDRDQLAKQAEGGYVDGGNQYGLVTPNQNSYIDSSLEKISYNKEKANEILDKAGYTKGSDGVRTKNGQRLSFKLNLPAGWTDWEKMASIIQANLKEIGIDIQVNGLQQANWTDALNNQKYDLSIGGTYSGPSPYYQFNNHLNSANIGHNGQNWSAWKDDETDKLLNQYVSNSANKDEQTKAIHGLEKVMVEKVPFIPLVNAGGWFEYTTKNFTGWPNKDNAYALGPTWSFPDNLMVVTNLKLKS